MPFSLIKKTADNSGKTQTAYYFMISMAAAAACFWIINIIFYWPKISAGVPNGSLFDDSFMFMRYAKNFLNGHGFSWNASDGNAYGNTSTVYLFLITLIRYMTSLPDWQILVFSSFTFSCFAYLTLILLIRSIRFQTREIPFMLIMLLTIFISFSYSWKYHSFTGMETMMSVFANTLLIISVLKFSNGQKVLWGIAAAASGYFTYLVRPDNGIYAILFPALFLLFSDKKGRLQLLIVPVSILFLCAADYFIKPMIFGTSLPFAFYSKQKGFFKLHMAQNLSMFNLSYFIKDCSIPYLIISAAFFNKKSKYGILSAMIPVILTFIYFATLNQFMGNYGRYYLPSLPFFIFSAAYSLSFAEYGSFKITGKNLKHGLIIFTIACIAAEEGLYSSLAGIEQRFITGQNMFTGVRSTSDLIFSRDNLGKQTEPLPSFTRFAKQLPEGTIITATEHGYLSAAALNTTIIDMAGLHDRFIAKNGLKLEYLQSRSPDVIWLPNHNYFTEMNLILDSKFFRENFDFYPELYGFGIGIRRSSPKYSQIKSIFYKNIEKDYLIIFPEHFRVDLDSLQNENEKFYLKQGSFQN